MSSILAGLYGFKPTDTFHGCKYTGDEQAGQLRMGHVRNALQTLHDVNKLDLQVYDHTVYFDDGTIVTAHRMFGQYSADVFVPSSTSSKLTPQEFYWVPGCVARYDAVKTLQNCIINSDISSDTIKTVGDISILSSHQCGLPSLGLSPGGMFQREYNIFILPGKSTNIPMFTGETCIKFPADSVPQSGAFTISCIARLNEPVKYDYTFTEKTNELDCNYTVFNPIKPRILFSTDGNYWSYDNPGSIAPLLGNFQPTGFSSHYIPCDFPWPIFNTNFVKDTQYFSGPLEISNPNGDEPLLSSDYDDESPYWDGVVQSNDCKTYEGEFSDFWEENASIANSDIYKSYCKWKTKYKREFSIGTRVIASDSDTTYYATVFDFEYTYEGFTLDGDANYSAGEEISIFGTDGTVSSVNKYIVDGIVVNTNIQLITFTTFTFKDHQYKIHIFEKNNSITFGDTPFPYSHPNGYMLGFRYCGLMWYNGNKILAGKICNFQSEYGYGKIISSELNIGSYYHICMTYNEDGGTCLYITEFGSTNTNLISEDQSTNSFNYGSNGDLPSGDNIYWRFGYNDSPISAWTFSSNMEIGLPRFYQRELSQKEVTLLTREAFDGVFVADDFEKEALTLAGYKARKI